MGLADFFDPNDENMATQMQQVSEYLFPLGDKDKEAGTNEVLYTLKNSVDRDLALNIFIKTSFMSRFSGKFDQNDLKTHLANYCLEHFNDQQIANHYNYLMATANARMLYGSPPSQITRETDDDPASTPLNYVDESWLDKDQTDDLPIDLAQLPGWMWLGSRAAAHFSLTEIAKNPQAAATDEIPEGTGRFGLDSTNPIPVYGIAASTIYLSWLYLSNGNKITWKREGAVMAKNIQKPVDVYEIFDQQQQPVGKLYISPYHKKISNKVPEGFTKV
jgi:hypothetical protein